jgi:hypothetical protein
MHLKIAKDLHPNERIHMMVRRHWIIPTIKLVSWVILILLVLGSEWLLRSWLADFYVEINTNIFELIRLSFLMLGFLGIFMSWIMYYLNVQVITNERIIDVNQKGLLHHETTEFNIEVLQDATTEIKGLIANALNFGNVHVQTAGENQNFVFDHVADPHKIARTIMELHQQAQNKRSESTNAS